MSDEQIFAMIIAVMGSNVATAWVSSTFTRRKTAAEAEHERMQVAALLIQQLREQVEGALERIRELEAEGKDLRRTVGNQAARIDDLERILRTNDVTFPPYMP